MDMVSIGEISTCELDHFATEKREKREDSEDGMYDNPSYNSCSRNPALVLEPEIYDQPKPSSEYQEPHLLPNEEDTYHKVINPLYTGQNRDPSLHPQQHKLDQDPYYATPSFSTPQCHTMMNTYQTPRVVLSTTQANIESCSYIIS